ncbi:uncharacterized protein LOC111336480 [Stylophora pistillata]|nr:uncharacterized protein LOC111336480 [Stylophora pistillata]
MDQSHIPLMSQAFAVPRDVFEGAMASKTSASMLTSSLAGSTSPFLNNPAAAAACGMYHCVPQRRRSSGESFISELSECEAKRPRLSTPDSVSAQMFAQRIESQNHKRETMKQLIFERIDRTKEKMLWMLKMQEMRELIQFSEMSKNGLTLHQISNSQGNKTQYYSPSTPTKGEQNKIAISACEENEPGSVALKIISRAPKTIQRAANDENRLKHLPPSIQRIRQVPGITVIMDPPLQSEQNIGYTCKSYDGLAWDHQALPKIVAVHSVAKHTSVNARNVERAPPSKPPAVAQIPSKSNTSGMSYYSAKSQETRMHSPVTYSQCDTRRGTSVFSESKDQDIVEVEVKEVHSRKIHRSRSAQKMCPETNVTNCIKYSGEGMKHFLMGACVEKPYIAKPTLASSYGNLSGNFDGYNSRIHGICSDSEIYHCGPPPYPAFLDSPELDKLEKQKRPPPVSGERRNSNPNSPRLTKTLPEISAKIIETRERIKTETIEWKKKLLCKVEKQLIRKLRRVEKETGEKTETEELREEEEAPARVSTEKRKRKSQSLEKRRTQIDSVTDEDEANKSPESDALENFPEAEERKESGDVRVEALLDQQHKQEGIFPSKDNKKEEKAAVSGYHCNSEDPSPKNEDCVTNEFSQETNPSSNLKRLRAKGGLNVGGAEYVQTCTAEKNTKSQLLEFSHGEEKSPQDFQTEDDCVTKNSNDNKDFTCRCLTSLEETMPLLKTSLTSSASGAKTKKQDKRDTKVQNLNSINGELQNCNKEVRTAKAATLSCERNIWEVLRGNGIS